MLQISGCNVKLMLSVEKKFKYLSLLVLLVLLRTGL